MLYSGLRRARAIDSRIAGENARCVMVPVFACITGQDWGGRSDGLTLGTKLKEESRNAKFRTNSILMQYLKNQK